MTDQPKDQPQKPTKIKQSPGLLDSQVIQEIQSKLADLEAKLSQSVEDQRLLTNGLTRLWDTAKGYWPALTQKNCPRCGGRITTALGLCNNGCKPTKSPAPLKSVVQTNKE